MPLSCDCYGGCWFEHSEGWPKVKDENRKLYIRAISLLPYGTYVTTGKGLRVETQELLDQLLIESGE